MLAATHRTFLSNYFKAGDHYSFDDHPLAYLQNKENISSDDLDSALSHRSVTVRAIAAAHENATKEHIDKALSDSEPDVVVNAATNYNATSDQIHTALKHPDWYVRARAVKAPNINKSHLLVAINDSEQVVRDNARSNSKFKFYFPAGYE